MDKQQREVLRTLMNERLAKYNGKDLIRIGDILKDMGCSNGFSLLELSQAEAKLSVEKAKRT
jgi:hypothetical protein